MRSAFDTHTLEPRQDENRIRSLVITLVNRFSLFPFRDPTMMVAQVMRLSNAPVLFENNTRFTRVIYKYNPLRVVL